MTHHICILYEDYLFELNHVNTRASNMDWYYVEREYQRCQDEGKIK